MAYSPAYMKTPTPKPIQTFKFPNGNNGGMNLRVQADQINQNQSPDMLNMCYREGVPSNRWGFNKVNSTSFGITPIRGMFSFNKPGGTKVILVAWGGKIYSLNTTTYALTSLCTGTKATLTDADTYFFTMGGKAYIYNGTDYCFYDGTNPVADVVGYVPTITTGRGSSGGGVANEELNYLSCYWKDSFTTVSGTTAYTLSFIGLTADTDTKAWLNGTELVLGVGYTVDIATGIVTLDADPGDNTDGLVVQAKKAGLEDTTLITKCTKFELYGGKNDNRIFGCNGNMRYRCYINDPTYWPLSGYEQITSSSEDIVGFGKMLDYLINLKEQSLSYTAAEEDSSGNPLWSVYPLNDEYGCLAPDTIKPVMSGLIFLAQTNEGSPAGFVYLSPSLVRSQMNVIPISRDINTSVHSAEGVKGLNDYTRAELEAAKAFVYDDKYWCRIGDRCWVLDLRYSDFANGVYVWYPYNGNPAKANCFLDDEGDFYIGDSTNGYIYKEEPDDVNEDGVLLDFYWTSPQVFNGSRTYYKDYEELAISFGRQVRANNKITFITDDGKEEVVVAVQAANAFDFGDIDFSAWTFGANPYPSTQPEIVGYSAEYLQWKIENDEKDVGLVILDQELTFQWGERV
jgi:hypothetical protein